MKKAFALGWFLFYAIFVNAQLRITKALCNNKINPLGVAASGIRFNWELSSNENNQTQTAYQLVISSAKEKLFSNTFNVYNSATVKSSASIMVAYKGKALQTGQTYFWKVRVWNKNNKPSAWSDAQQFTTALNMNDWRGAQWIGYEILPDSMRIAPGIEDVNSTGNKGLQRTTVPYFRKEFAAKNKIK